MVDRTKEIVNGAVATHLGWVNPKTGELLVSIRGLSDAVTWTRKDGLEDLQDKLKRLAAKSSKTIEAEEEIAAVLEVVIEEPVAEKVVTDEVPQAPVETTEVAEKAPEPIVEKPAKATKKTTKKTKAVE